MYFELINFQTIEGSPIQSLENTIEFIVEKETAPPYFVLAPASSYEVEPGSTLDLLFEVRDDEPNDYLIEVAL